MASSPSALSSAAAFSGTVQPAKIPLYYQLGLAVVALAMVLLPLIYLALIAAVAWGVWWHLKNDFVILEHTSGRGTLLGLLVYLTPALVGGIFVLFLIKPLFARRQKAGKAFTLKESDEPELFAFVRKICDLVGAPQPSEVRLDCLVNASAGFRHGWLSMITGDLVLTLGMPLVAGMTARQVAGVIAHEFGHFAQGAGMRLSYIIRSVNAWFFRVVHERDAWDDWLEQWASNEDWRVKIIFKLAQGGVWVGRNVLRLLGMAGHAISCFMSRQMEFDADSYEAQIAGSSEFARTSERLRQLNAAYGAAIHDARSKWQHRELPDDLPALVTWRESVMPAEVRKEIEASVAEEKSHWAQTHPCDRDRVKAAEALAAPGLFHLDEPASVLFADFPATCRAVTRHFYEHEQGLPLDKAKLRSNAEMMADRQAADDAGKHLGDFFGEFFALSRVQPLPETTAQAWQPSNAMMRGGQTEYVTLLKQHGEFSAKVFKQSVGYDLVQAKFSLSSPHEFGLNSSNDLEVQRTLAQTTDMRRNLESAMQRHEDAAFHRMAAALTWLDAQPEDSAEAKERRALLIKAQRALARVVKEFSTVEQARSSLDLLIANANGHQDGIYLRQKALAIAGRCEMALNHILNALGDLQHPYLGAGTPIRESLHVPEKGDDEFVRAYKAAEVCEDALKPLLLRLMGELCGQALAAEERFKHAPPAQVPMEVTAVAGGGLPMPSL